MTPQVSVVIVNWNVKDLLRACLTSLLEASGLPRDALQVIVVDNDSRDGSAQMVAGDFPDVLLIANPDNPGFGRANNQALPLCTGRYILLLNPDTVVLDGAVRRMLASLDSRPDVGVLGCRLQNGDGSLQRWTGGAFPSVWNLASHYLFIDRILPRALRPRPLYLDDDTHEELDVDWVSGACMLLRPEALAGSLFDPAFFMYGEDMELCHRLKSAGYRILYAPSACIVHYQGASMRQQQGDVLLSPLKGPRQFYRRIHGERAVWWFDLLTVSGFALRWLLYASAAWGRPQRFAARAASSKALMARARRLQQS